MTPAPPPFGPPVSHADEAMHACDGDWTRGVIWRGGEQVARLLRETPELVRGRAVVEVGTGTGVVGLTAAAVGASSVLLTDQDLTEAAENVARNPAIAATVRLAELSWGEASHVSRVRAAGSWDITVAADLVHPANVQVLPLLVGTLRALGAPALLAYVERSARTTADVHAALGAAACRCHWRRAAQSERTRLYALGAWCDRGGPCVESDDALDHLLPSATDAARSPAETGGAPLLSATSSPSPWPHSLASLALGAPVSGDSRAQPPAAELGARIARAFSDEQAAVDASEGRGGLDAESIAEARAAGAIETDALTDATLTGRGGSGRGPMVAARRGWADAVPGAGGALADETPTIRVADEVERLYDGGVRPDVRFTGDRASPEEERPPGWDESTLELGDAPPLTLAGSRLPEVQLNVRGRALTPAAASLVPARM